MMLHISPWPARFNNVYGYYNDFLSDNFTEIEPCLDQDDEGPHERQLVLSNKEVEHLRKAMWINRVEMSRAFFNLGVTSIYKGYDEKGPGMFISLTEIEKDLPRLFQSVFLLQTQFNSFHRLLEAIYQWGR